MFDEGKEEVIQGMISQALQRGYGKQNPLFSTTDENAVINPRRAGEEFLGGAVVGGILGGAQIGVQQAVNRAGRLSLPSVEDAQKASMTETRDGDKGLSLAAHPPTTGPGGARAALAENAPVNENTAPGTGTVKADTSLFDSKILSNLNQARKYLVEFARKNFPSSVVNRETGKEIGISRTGIDKFLSGRIGREKYASGFHIPQLVESARKVGEAANYHPETVRSIPTFEYYDSGIEIDGKQYTAHIRVKNTGIGDRYYGHTISEVDQIEIELPARTSAPEVRGVQPVNAIDSSVTTIPQQGAAVNPRVGESINRENGARNVENGGNLYEETGADVSDGGAGRDAGVRRPFGRPSPKPAGGRPTGAGAGEPGGGVEPGAGGRVNVSEQQRTADKRAGIAQALQQKPVSSRSLGLQDGTDAERLIVMPESAWDREMRTVAAWAQRESRQSVTYISGNMQIETAEGTRMVRGARTEDGIIVQADNRSWTVEQIASHELFHDKAAKTPGLVWTARQRILTRYSEAELNAVLEKYMKNLRGVYETEDAQSEVDYILEELLADAYEDRAMTPSRGHARLNSARPLDGAVAESVASTPFRRELPSSLGRSARWSGRPPRRPGAGRLRRPQTGQRDRLSGTLSAMTRTTGPSSPWRRTS